MIKPEVLDAMVAAGCTAQQIAAAVKADQAGSSGAARQARYRARKASQSDERDVTTVTVTGDLSPKKEIPPTPPKEKITPIPVSEAKASSTDGVREFARFWSIFPNKVGKRDAEKAFASARKRSPLDAILAGVSRYAAKTDDRPWCNPSTFLNQDRWADQPAATVPRIATSPPGNRKPTALDAYEAIAKERGWTTDEPEIIPSNNDDAQLIPAEFGRHSGAVVDLRPGAFRRVGPRDR